MRNITPYQRRDSLWDFMSEVEKAFDQAWRTSDSTPVTREFKQTFAPAVDLHETSDYYLISVDLPGIDQKDIKIDVEDGRLTVSGERTREERKEDGMFKRYERSYGSFARSFQLPQNVNEDQIQARTENGVLEIMVPKAEKAKARSVQVEAGKGGLFSKLIGSKKETKEAKTEEKH
jgi:HSP20 family protein